MYSILDAMKTQVHETTGHSPCELVFGQKPHATIFPRDASWYYNNQWKRLRIGLNGTSVWRQWR